LVRRTLDVIVVAAAIAWCGTSRADELGTPIDLTSFGEPLPAESSGWDDSALHNVAWRSGRAQRRIYLSGMIGPSFANVTSPADSTLASEDMTPSRFLYQRS
jgi:hypothetical protein